MYVACTPVCNLHEITSEISEITGYYARGERVIAINADEKDPHFALFAPANEKWEITDKTELNPLNNAAVEFTKECAMKNQIENLTDIKTQRKIQAVTMCEAMDHIQEGEKAASLLYFKSKATRSKVKAKCDEIRKAYKQKGYEYPENGRLVQPNDNTQEKMIDISMKKEPTLKKPKA